MIDIRKRTLSRENSPVELDKLNIEAMRMEGYSSKNPSNIGKNGDKGEEIEEGKS